jgi:hypothetical protein
MPVDCHRAFAKRFNHANGIVRGQDNLFYIASSWRDRIRVMELQNGTQTLVERHVLKLGYPIDNMSMDQRGDIYAASFPKILDVVEAFENPYDKGFPSTIWRIRRLLADTNEWNYEIKKIIEHQDSEIINGATVAIHDAKTGRLFMSGMI